MGRKCCVANCKGNYDKQAKVKVYRLARNLEERKRWLTIIPRNIIPLYIQLYVKNIGLKTTLQN